MPVDIDSHQRRCIGTLKLVAHLFRSIAGIPSGPAAESSFISEIASKMWSCVSFSSVSLLLRGGSVNDGGDLSGLFVSLKTEQNCCCSMLASSLSSVTSFLSRFRRAEILCLTFEKDLAYE